MTAWRCFHCDDCFDDRQADQDHFGLDCLEPPACVAMLTEGEKAILESRREWRDEALKLRSANEELEQRAHELRFDLTHGRFKGARSAAEAWTIHREALNELEAEQQALAAAGPWVSGLLRWLGEWRACRLVGLPRPKLRLYLP